MRTSAFRIILFFALLPLFSGAALAQVVELDPKARQMISLRAAIARGIEQNFNLRVDELDVPIRREEVTVADSAFDPALQASVYTGERRILSGEVLYEDEYRYIRETGADAGIRKRWKFGLQSGLTFRTVRTENNSLADALDPDYQNFLILNLTQPLLRDFGFRVNTTQIRISENQVQAAVYNYLNQAQQLAARIENAYFTLSNALAVLGFRIESRELARELMEGNRTRLRQGVIAVTEVQQAETAVAARDEEVIAARQQVETVTNRLKDLLEIDPGDPLYDAPLATEPIPGVTIPYPEREKAVSVALHRRPDLKRLHIAVENQDIRLAFFRNRKLPRLDLGATLGVNGLAGEERPVTLFGIDKTSPLTGDYEDAYSSMVEDDGYEWSVDLTFSYPMGNRAAEARYAQSRMEKRQAIYRVKRLEGGIITAVRNSLVTVQRSLERVRVAEHFENLARTTLDQEMTRLKRGLSDTFRILDFQDELVRAHIRQVKAVIDFHQGMANLYRAMGANLDRYDILADVDSEALERPAPAGFPVD